MAQIYSLILGWVGTIAPQNAYRYKSVSDNIPKGVGFAFAKGVGLAIACTIYQIFAFITPVLAQNNIVPDNTLGAESSVVTPNALGLPRVEITGGAVRGANLFHSFQEFNVDVGRFVYFSPDANIQNILTRVTGGQVTNILGTLGVNGGANLFLLNPNGIVFGANAQLDVRGSFLGTTANSFVFPQGVFSATNPQTPPLLTINVPIGLQFGSQPGSIKSVGSALEVTSGSTLALIGGEIVIDGSLLFALNGQLQLGAVGGDTTVGLGINDSSLSFSLPSNARRSPITLTNRSLINTIGNSAIGLFGGQIALDSSAIFGLNGGSISIDATGLSLDNGSLLITRTTNTAKAGDIRIQANDVVTLTNSSIFSQSINAAGNGGDISINARNISVLGEQTIFESTIKTFTNSQGNAGNLTLLATESVNVTNRGVVSVETDGAGKTGDLTIRAKDSVNVTNNGILALGSYGSGSTGNLRIETGTFRVQNTPQRGVGTFSEGSGSTGSIFIQARDAVEIINGNTTAYANPNREGSISNINIETQRLNLRDGGNIITNTYGAADAGNIFIQAGEFVEIGGVAPFNLLSINQISSATREGRRDNAGNIIQPTGNGGNITIKTPRFTLSKGGLVTTSSQQSRGNAGNITILAKDVEIDGFTVLPNGFSLSRISTDVSFSEADVKGGTLKIDTERLRLSNGAYLTTSVIAGRGQAGNLVIRASDSVDISGVGPKNRDGLPFSSGLFAQVQTEAIGSGGSINVETGRLSLSNRGQILATTFAQGSAGNILINADLIDVRGEWSAIDTQVADQATGDAGDIRINTQRLNLLDGGFISSSTFGNGNAGNLIIQANDITLNGEDSGLYASTDENSSGFGGNISVNARQLNILDRARISVNSRGSGIAGNININAQKVQLSDRARIIAETTSQNGGNINIQNSDLLLLRQGSSISTTAAQGGNGGNININSQFIVAVPQENSDITANAFLGAGGRVQINTRSIFGIQSRPQLTDFSDITASSSFGLAGEVNIYTPQSEPLQNSLIELPENIIDANALIANSCIAKRNNPSASIFLITGNGGLPERPGDADLSPYTTGKIRSVSTGELVGTNSKRDANKKISAPIVEAQGIYRLANGDMVLSRECP